MQRKLIIYLLYSIFCILSSVFCLLFSVFYHLHLSRILYKSAPFMQNKPNFQDVQMNVNIYYTKVYKNETALGRGQNKPNSNPNKPNFQKAQINVNSFITKNYRKKDVFSVRINKPNFQNDQNERKLNFNKGLQKKRLFSSQKNKPNSNPISSKAKMNANLFVTKDYENETAFRPRKNKPNFFKGQNRLPENPATPNQSAV